MGQKEDNYVLSLENELARVQKEFSDFRKAKDEELTQLADSYLLESEKSCKLQRKVDLLEEEVSSLKKKEEKSSSNNICCEKQRRRYQQLQNDYETMENELACAHGSLIKKIDENDKNVTKINKLKVYISSINQEHADEKEELIDTINRLDGQVAKWRKEYEMCENLLKQSKVGVAKSTMRNEGYELIQQDYDYEFMQAEKSRCKLPQIKANDENRIVSRIAVKSRNVVTAYKRERPSGSLMQQRPGRAQTSLHKSKPSIELKKPPDGKVRRLPKPPKQERTDRVRRNRNL